MSHLALPARASTADRTSPSRSARRRRLAVSAALSCLVAAAAVPLAPAHAEGADAGSYDVPSLDAGCPADEVQDAQFPDVREGAHKRGVDCAVHWDVSRGNRGAYFPTVAVTRGQLATFLARALTRSGAQLPEQPPDAFDDDQAPHDRAIDQLAALQIVQGVGPRTFRPHSPVSRAQMATFLVRALEHRLGGELQSGRSGFTDISDSSHGAAIDKAATVGLAAGTAPGRYDPQLHVQRDQMATFLARALSGLVHHGHASVPRSRGEAPGDPYWGDFLVERSSYGHVVRFDPCRPVSVVANFDGAQPRAREALVQALAQLSAGTGMHWRYDGETPERAQTEYDSRASYQPQRYGDRWAPVLVNWPVDWQSGFADGLGGPTWEDGRDRAVSLTGEVHIAPKISSDTYEYLVFLLMHELGHVAGLDHPRSRYDVMSQGGVFDPDTGDFVIFTEWGEGDRRGLAQVGRGAGCLQTPAPRRFSFLVDLDTGSSDGTERRSLKP